jgi:hypothetical protein
MVINTAITTGIDIRRAGQDAETAWSCMEVTGQIACTALLKVRVGGTPQYARGDGPGMSRKQGARGLGRRARMGRLPCTHGSSNVHALPGAPQTPIPWRA